MRSIFQEEEGIVEELQGVEIIDAKASKLSYDQENEVTILWLKPKGKKHWYRIFIDFLHCNVQIEDGDEAYLKSSKLQESMSEWLDDIEIIDYPDWFAGETISCATVCLLDTGGIRIELTIKLASTKEFTLSLLDSDVTKISRK